MSSKTLSLYEQCLELSLDWDSTEDIVHGCVEHVSKAKDAEIERLKAVLKALVTKLDTIAEDSQFQGVFAMNHIHGGKYTGPNWVEELHRAREATR